MKEWTELTKDNFPKEVPTVKYEWQSYKHECGGWTPCMWGTVTIFMNLWKGTVTRKFRYRETENRVLIYPGDAWKTKGSIENKIRQLKNEITDLESLIKQPTHETLAECYINDDMGPLGLNLPHDLLRNAVAEIQGNCEREVKLAFIAGRKSADIPQEV